MDKKIIDFLEELSQNNHKTWFDENRKKYEICKDIFKTFVEGLIYEVSQFDENIKGLLPQNCVFRINRDVRFSKDKSPYKTNFGTILQKGGKKTLFAGYYIHIEPNGGAFIAGGLYTPPNDVLVKIRQEIDYNFSDFLKIIENNDFQKTFGNLRGEKLAKAPKGYAIENPAIEFLKMKSLIAWHEIPENILLESDNFIQYVVNICKKMKPFLDFVNVIFEENEK
ncbi:MAG: DUF2461 domain-containing protein [Bacteroidetes bacterium]|nr:MAG: DUF2461 domain-containing protein [Bacteroidota bacterium]TAG87811.1 MAG: DUF2461 domain-containing protein [Bacteroidota bacterium]